MQWGSFGIVHIVSLAAAAAMVTGLYFALKGKSARTQTAVLGVLSFSGIAAERHGAAHCGVHPQQDGE